MATPERRCDGCRFWHVNYWYDKGAAIIGDWDNYEQEEDYGYCERILTALHHNQHYNREKVWIELFSLQGDPVSSRPLLATERSFSCGYFEPGQHLKCEDDDAT